MRKLQCPKCESTEILYCPIVEECWTIETIHESGALDLKDLEDSVTTGEHSYECAGCTEKYGSIKEMKIFEPEEDGLRSLFDRQMKSVKNLIKRYT
tara:strand:+ start:556 stop:843 length:288 start_codon:yes stop_codon:yes gene_type:complete